MHDVYHMAGTVSHDRYLRDFPIGGVQTLQECVCPGLVKRVVAWAWAWA